MENSRQVYTSTTNIVIRHRYLRQRQQTTKLTSNLNLSQTFEREIMKSVLLARVELIESEPVEIEFLDKMRDEMAMVKGSCEGLKREGSLMILNEYTILSGK